MRRALSNSINYNTNSDNQFPPFNPNEIEGWSKMTPKEQEEAKFIYGEFEKLAHLMDDWAQQFDKDIEAFEKEHPNAQISKPVTTPANAPASARKDTGSRSQKGWRNL